MIKDFQASEESFQELHSFLQEWQPYSPYAGSYALCVEFYTFMAAHEKVRLFTAYDQSQLVALFTPMALEGMSSGVIAAMMSDRCDEDLIEDLVERSVEFLAQSVSTIQLICRDIDSPVLRKAIRRYGFTLKDQSYLSSYDCTEEIAQSLIDKESSTMQSCQGGQVLTLDEFKARDSDWKTKWYQFEQETVVDVPSEVPMEGLQFDDWETLVLGRVKSDTCLLFLVVNDQVVGLLNALKSGAFYFIEFTGVAREYRRRGISSLLKVHLIRYAQAQGIESIRTMNHHHNPMFQLNLQFGFKLLETQESYVMELTQEKS